MPELEQLKEKNFVSAVIYSFNCEDQIENFILQVYNQLQQNFQTFEIICVDDASDDFSVDKIKEISKRLSGDATINLVRMSFFQGLDSAMNAGISLALGDFVFEFDSPQMDFNPLLIMEIYKKSLSGYDIVSAVPKLSDRISSRIFYKVFNRFSDFSYRLQTERFRVLSRRAINRTKMINTKLPYRKATYASCGLALDHIAYDSKPRNSLNSQERKFRKGTAIDSLILFTNISYKSALIMAILMCLFAIFTGVYAIILFTSGSKPVPGWTTTILFLSAAFFGVFSILAMIIKYMAVLIGLVFQKQNFVFESVEKLK